jgi:hypothetical protein
LDSETIETEATSDNSSPQLSAVSVASRFISWGRNGQFLISGDPILTPQSVVVEQVSSYTSDQIVDVLPLEDKLIYTFKRGQDSDRDNNTGVAEYFLDDLTLEKFKNFDITGHIPTYIKGSPRWMVVNDNTKLLVLKTSTVDNLLYVYKYYYEEGNKRLQMAWFKMQLCEDCEILGGGFIDHKLLLVNRYADGIHLEYIDTSPNLKDPYSTEVFLLDRRITDEDCSTSYSPSTNTTTFTLPYEVEDPDRLLLIGRHTEEFPDGGIVAYANEDDTPLTDSDLSILIESESNGGTTPTITDTTATSITVSGDWTEIPCFIGILYDSVSELSKPMVRQQTQSGGSIAMQNGNFFVRNGVLSLSNTRTITVEIQHLYNNQTYNSTYLNSKVGVSNWRLGANSKIDDTFRFWVQAKNTNFKIFVKNNSPFQHSILAIDYEGSYSARSKQL